MEKRTNLTLIEPNDIQHIEPSQTTNLEPAAQRIAALDSLYKSNYQNIWHSIYEAVPETSYADEDSIMKLLASRLCGYDSELSDDAFTTWATHFVQYQAIRYSLFTQIIEEHKKLIAWAARKYLNNNSGDGSETAILDAALDVEDIVSEIHALILRYIDDLAIKGNAKLSTRIVGLIKRHTGFVRKKRFNRSRIVKENELDIGKYGCTTFSDMELRSMRFDMNENSNSGYQRNEDVTAKSHNGYSWIYASRS